MIHVLATALVTQRISEEISGAGVLIASKVAIGDLSFLFPGWRCPPADCQLPLRQEGAECCTCSCSSLHSTLLCFLLPSSNLSFPPHNSSTFTLVPTSFTFPLELAQMQIWVCLETGDTVHVSEPDTKRYNAGLVHRLTVHAHSNDSVNLQLFEDNQLKTCSHRF